MAQPLDTDLRPAAGVADAASAHIPAADPITKPRIGVITGLGYRNLSGDLPRLIRLLRDRPIPHETCRNPDDVARALDRFEREGVNVVAVSGGDGTVAMVCSYLVNRNKPAPLVALLEGGRTNMTAQDCGMRGKQLKALRRLFAWARDGGEAPGVIVERNLIGVDQPGQDRQCGFFIGGGAVYEGSLRTWAFRDDSKFSFMQTGLGTTLGVAKLILKHIINRSGFTPCKQTILADGKPLDETNWSAIWATTLDELVFGFNPFWSDDPEGAIRLSGVSADHTKFFRAGPAALRGKANKHLVPENGYHSVRADSYEIEVDGGITLDGQIIHHRGPGLRIGIAGRLRFLRG